MLMARSLPAGMAALHGRISEPNSENIITFAYPYINHMFTDIVRGSEATLMKGF